MELIEIYEILLEKFGEQEWWPMKKTFRPKEFEVCVGAILTQNTNWNNVEKSLKNLGREKLIDAKSISKVNTKKLETVIKSSGFYKQKAKKLKAFAKISVERDFYKNITREKLLKIHGIGKETADSILLYACNKPFFVIDAYTRRIFSRIGFFDEDMEYDEIRKFFEENLPKDVDIYKEFHALVVELAKKYCKKKPNCEECPFRDGCEYNEYKESEHLF
jgi:endonuclease-3 related protein